MNIYLMETEKGVYAFVEFGAGYMLCIGKKEDIDNADSEQIRRMVQEAVAYGRFHGIGDSKGQQVN